MSENNESNPTYVFELSEEAKRLEKQGQFLAPLSRRLFEDAGITAGMKVLEVGCGAGDVAIDTLAQRLRDEVVSQRGVVMGLSLVSAWTHRSSSHL